VLVYSQFCIIASLLYSSSEMKRLLKVSGLHPK